MVIDMMCAIGSPVITFDAIFRELAEKDRNGVKKDNEIPAEVEQPERYDI